MAPLSLPKLDVNLTNKIFLFVIVALSADEPNWYSFLASVSKKTQKAVDEMLQDPRVLEEVTFWDHSETENFSSPQINYLDSITENGLSKVKKLRVIAERGDRCHPLHTYLLGDRFSSLRHLHIEGASSVKLSEYLNHFEGRLEHLTTDSVICEHSARTTLWPRKVTILSAICTVRRFVFMVVVAHSRGMEELEVGPACDSLALQLFESAKTTQQLKHRVGTVSENIKWLKTQALSRKAGFMKNDYGQLCALMNLAQRPLTCSLV